MKRTALLIGLLMCTISAWANPSTPTGLAVVTNTATSANLTWNSVSGIGIKYNIYQNGTLLGNNGGTNAQVSGLVTGVSYGFGVQAFDINNLASAVSPYVTITAGSGVTPTGQVQNVYCVNCSSGSGGGGGSVTQGTSPWVTSGTITGSIPTGNNTIGAVGVTSMPTISINPANVYITGTVNANVTSSTAQQITITASSITLPVSVTAALPAGTNYIGAINISNTSAISISATGGAFGVNNFPTSLTNGDWVSGDTPEAQLASVEAYLKMSNTAGTADNVMGDTTNGLWVNLKNAVALTVNTHAVTQSGAWAAFVTPSVGTSSGSPAFISVTGQVPVTCSNCTSGSSGASSGLSLGAQTTTAVVGWFGGITSSVSVNTHAVTQSGAWAAFVTPSVGVVAATPVFVSIPAGTYLTANPVGGAFLGSVSFVAGAIGTSSGNPQYVNQAGLTYYNSVSNNSSVQLASSATFTGAIEGAFNQPAAQVMVFGDQPMTIYCDQFNALNNVVETDTFTYVTFTTGIASQGFNRNIMITGDAFRVRCQNTGAGTTTTFNLETTYGTLPPEPNAITSLGNKKIALMELGGLLLNAAGIPISGTVNSNLYVAGAANNATNGAFFSNLGNYSTGRYVTTAAGATNATSIKASSGMITGLWASNTNGSTQYIKLYDVSYTPQVGVTVPMLTIGVPANGGFLNPVGASACLTFTSGIATATTANSGDTDATSIAASTLKFIINWK